VASTTTTAPPPLTTTTVAASTTTTAPATVEAAFLFVQIDATPSSTLPVTGSSSTAPLAALGIALLAIGTFACLASRRPTVRRCRKNG
jgi:LPXTG-motif cell wall-anchored protein